MTSPEAVARYADLQQELTALLLLLASEDPEPEAIEACHARIAVATAGLADVSPAAEELDAVRAAATETERLARAAAEAALHRREALTVEQAQLERQHGALGAYRPPSDPVASRFIDRRG